jgi:hypothetical protein
MGSGKTGAEINAGIENEPSLLYRIIEFWIKNENANIRLCIKKLIKK